MKDWILLNRLQHRIKLLLAIIMVCIYMSGCGGNALYNAVRYDDINKTRSLINKGADVNAGKVPPLITASFKSNTEIVRMLLENGADTEVENQHGVTPLHWAAEKGNDDIAEMLIEHGADVNHQSKNGGNPLVSAAMKGNLKIAKMLVEKGADIETENKHGITPLYWAAEKAHEDIAELLIEHGANVNHRTDNGSTPLSGAAFGGNIKIVNMLLEKGANVNDENEHGVTPLFWAAEKGFEEIAESLINHGADVNYRSDSKSTPLSEAAFGGKVNIVNMLLEKGANVNDENEHGVTPLIWAATKGHGDIVVSLVERGADVNHVTENDQTAFKSACQTGNSDMAIYLYENGASTDFDDSTLEGMELNGTLHHILGDYFFSQDKIDDAQDYFTKAKTYYCDLEDKYSGDVTKLAWKKFGVIMLHALAGAAQSYASSYQANMQSRQLAQISALKYANSSNTGLQGYSAYMNKYNKTYVPTYQGINMASVNPPADTASIDAKKAYAKAKVRHYKKLSESIEKILNCFDSKQDAEDIHTCVAEITALKK